MPDLYQMNVADVIEVLESDIQDGLLESEALTRQIQHGKNILPKGEGTGLLKLIIAQFTDMMVLILLAAAVISFFVGDVKDVIVILVIVVLNAILGVYQEYRAEQSLAALSAMQVPLVIVRRDGKVHEISAEELVPGDIVLLDEGNRTPADGRIIASANLHVEEAALTGESQPDSKDAQAMPADKDIALADRKNMVYMGTSVTFGRGEFVVTATGLKTELGNIAALLMQVEKGVTPLQRRLEQIGKALAIGAALIVAVVFVAGLLRGIELEEMFLVAISLAVAAVP